MIVNKQGLIQKLLLCSFLSLASTPVKAQITPDSTLGAEPSKLTPNVLIKGADADLINGGALRGNNLFHSFTEFNIKDGQSVYFTNPSGVVNILTRVTGKNASNILGTLGVDGGANLFLINPNGILFGQNARLDIGGSFLGTTANGVQFGNQGNFSATNAEAPGLLTINPSALFFNQINPNAAIENNSVAPVGIFSAGFDAFGLRVPDGKSLLLVGGNVIMDGGQLNAFGGRVELGGLVSKGNVNMSLNGSDLRLEFPDNVTRATVTLNNTAGAFVTGAGGGYLTINASNIDILSGSILSAGIGQGLGAPETIAGDITLSAIGEIKIAGSGSQVRNLVRIDSKGHGGNITIDAGSLKLEDGANLSASTYGKGNAGNVTVNALNSISLTGGDIFSIVGASGVGKGGNININGATLSLTDGARLESSTYGIGNAGNVTVNTLNNISLAGSSYIFSTIEAGGVGKGGDININGATLSLADGAQLLTITHGADGTQAAGKGSAGNVNVKVRGTVDIAGQKNGFDSKISSDVKTETEGNAGNITIDAGSLNLRDGARLEASTYGIGNAGNVTITAKDSIFLAGSSYILSMIEAGGVGKGGDININGATLSLTDGAQLGTGTRSASDTQRAGRGDAGNVNIKVTGVIDLAGEKDTSKSAIDSRVETGTVGNAGNITIDTGSLKFRSGAGGIAASSFGRGNAGNVTVRAKNDVSLVDGNIFSTVEAGGVGNGGNIDINASSLSLLSGAQLLTFTREAFDTQPAGQGNAGNINVRVTGDVDIAGEKNGFPSQITSSIAAGTIGNGGNITINSASFSLRDNAKLSASTYGQGNAGNIDVKVTGAVTLLGTKDTNTTSAIFSGVEPGGVGKAGNITIDADSFLLRDNIQLTASTSGQGSAGNVIVRARNAVSLVGGSILSTVQAGGVGKGGNIDINAAMLSLTDGAQLQTITFGASDTQGAGQGSAGNVNIKVTNAVEISGFGTAIGSLVETGTQGNGGNITIDANSFYLRNGAFLDARTQSDNKGGNITINANTFEALTGGRLITNTESNGSAGKITINAANQLTISGNNPNYNDQLIIFPSISNIGANAGLFVNSTGPGTTGDIEINSPNITLDNQGKLEANSTSGNGGNIKLNSDLLLLRRGAQISTNAGTEQLGGDGGNIDIDSRFIVAVPNENSDITANAFSGKGGNVNIRAQGIFGIEPRAIESPQTSDITASSERGVQGEVSITQPDVKPAQGLIELPEEVVDATRKVAQICPREPGAKPLGEFTITGRGSLPPSPLEPLPGATNTTKLATLDTNNTNVSKTAPNKVQNAIVEAQGWVKNQDGSLELVAMAPNTTPSARVVVSVCPSN